MSANIGLSLSATKLEVAPGESVEATVAIRNQSQVVDEFDIRIQGLDPTWWTLSTTSVSLFPGDYGEAKLTIQPPKEAEAKAGSYSFQVRAVSQASPGEMTEEEAYLVLRGFLVWDVEMSPTKVVGESGTYRLTANNSGNTDITLIFEGKDPEESLNYAFSHVKVTVPAGESALITLKVRPKKGEKGELYSFQVLGRPVEAKVPSREVKTINGQLEYRRRRGNAWKWILLVLALLAVAFAIWKFIPPLLNPPLAIINSFTADRTSIFAGDSSTLSWSVSGATQVTIDPGIGSVALTGTRTVSPTTTTTYTLMAGNKAGDSKATFQVTVLPPLPIITTFFPNPISITAGSSSTLSWSVSNATTVTIDQGIGSVALTGTRTISPTATTTYTLTASNAAGNTTTATAQVIVSAPYLPVINYFKATPTTIWDSGSSTLSWSISGATQVTIDQGIGSVALTGTRVVSLTTTTTYTLTASNAAGSLATTARVTVFHIIGPIEPIEPIIPLP